MRLAVSAFCLGLLVAWPAGAQSWQQYSFDDVIEVSFPAPPAAETGLYKTAGGLSAPSKIHTVKYEGVVYSLTIADFSSIAMGRDAALADTLKVYAKRGKLKLNEPFAIDDERGRTVSVSERDGSLSSAAIFFTRNHLYLIEGKAPAPHPEDHSGETARFRQNMHFIGQQGVGVGRLKGLTMQNFLRCDGKPEGAMVTVPTDNGEVTATCKDSPLGMIATLPGEASRFPDEEPKAR